MVGTGRFELPTCREVGDRAEIETARNGCACALKRNCGEVVGTGRFELPTCRLGGDRSIHLSYIPEVLIVAVWPQSNGHNALSLR